MIFPYFISKKYILNKKESKFLNLINVIAIIGIAIGTAALIITLSILGGFEKTLTSKLIDFDSHIQILSYQSVLPDYHNGQPIIENILKGSLKSISPYASKLAIISSKRIRDGVNIKGIFPNISNISQKKDIIEGEFNIFSDSSIVIGKKLANKLFVKVGDKVTIFSLKNDQVPSVDNMPNIKNFYVTGIYESGMSEYDDLFAFVNLNTAQNIFNLGDNVTGYDVKLNDVSKIDSVEYLLSYKLRYPYVAKSIYHLHRNIFTWIELQKKPIPIILGLIIVVAVFNIISTLLMMVLEKTQAIGILKSLGANKNKIIGIFLIHATFISLIGIIIGNFISFIFIILQLNYHLLTLPSSVYFMNSVPVILSGNIFLLVSGIAFSLSIIAAILPSYIAAKIKPINSLRFS